MNLKLNTQLLWKTIFIHITFSALIGCMIYSYLRNASREQSGPKCWTEKNTVKFLNTDEKDDEELIILLWSWPRGKRLPLDQCTELCGISGCNFTADRSWYNRSSAVILRHRDVCNNKALLPQDPRPENQRWVWFNRESPRNSPNLHFMDNLINLTMSHRADSDIFSPYGGIDRTVDPREFNIPNKTKLVAWIVSNWNRLLVRLAYYNELKKHLKIDMYGKRGTPLAMEKMHSTIAQYKFYLAFENSVAIDYISEKFWRNALMSGTVPVVLGTTRENYERFIPGDAFIHVNDFPSAKELAAYLHYLDSNDEQYRRYFDWRKRFQPFFNDGWCIHYCTACQALRQNPTYKTIPSIYKWYKNPEQH